MVIDTTEHYILILVCGTLTLIQGQGDASKHNLLYQLSSKVMNEFNGIWHAVGTCWFYLSYTHYAKDVTAKKSGKYDENGWLEHLRFLFIKRPRRHFRANSFPTAASSERRNVEKHERKRHEIREREREREREKLKNTNGR